MNRMKKIILCVLAVLCLLACSASEAEKPVPADTVKMPDLTGQSMISAVEKLNTLGFQSIRTEKSNDSSDDSRFIVTEQNISAGTETDLSETVILTCMRQFDLLLNIGSEKNLLFSKYDLDILVDNEKLGTVKNGEQFEKSIRLIEGNHELTVCKHDEAAIADTYKISLKADTELAATAAHGKSGVSIRNPKLNEKEEVLSRTRTVSETAKPTQEPESVSTPAPTPKPTSTPAPEPTSTPDPEPTFEPESETAAEPTPEITSEPVSESISESSSEPAVDEESESSADTEETVLPEENTETKEPAVTSKPFSTAYEDAEGYKKGRAGSYVFKVPDTWVKGDKRFDVSENGKGPYFTFAQGEEEDIDALSIPELLEEYQSQFEFEEILEKDESYYFGGNKTCYVKGIERVKETKTRIHEIYMFADKLFKKPVIFNFYQPADTELDYSRDFMSVMSSIEDYTYTVKDVLTKGYELTYSTDVLEYSNKETDLLKLVSTKKKGVVISTDDKIDLSKPGEYTVTYTLTRGLISASEQHVFTVKDTKKPKIKIEKKKITLKYDQEYDPFDNIISIKDPVDGALEYVDEDPGEPGDGWYYVEGPEDIDWPGQYKYTIHACDKHGNKTKKTFTIKRKNPPAPKYDYIANRNTKVFHETWCRDISRMKEKNKRYYYNVTRNSMINMGYRPCAHCNP